MKKFFTLFFTLLVAVSANAQSDFEIASSFMSKKGITIVCDTYSRNRASSNSPYSIFHGVDDKGFVIVKNGVVIGYSTEDSIDEEDMPCALEKMLNGQVFTNSRRVARNTTPIEPLVKTKWEQYEFGRTYLNFKPNKGICAVVAYAQLVHFWQIPQTYEEFTIIDEYNHVYGTTPITTFNHSKMLDEYKEGEYTQENADEIAKFYFYISRIFHSKADTEKILNLDYYKIADIKQENRNTIFDDVLDKGIPFFTFGSGHGYIVDGRDSEGRYHTNFGWRNGSGYYYYLENDDEETNDSPIYTHGVFVIYYFTPKGWTSSVSNVKSDVTKSDGVYDIKGQKVGDSLDGLPKGLYITNGEKYVVK